MIGGIFDCVLVQKAEILRMWLVNVLPTARDCDITSAGNKRGKRQVEQYGNVGN